MTAETASRRERTRRVGLLAGLWLGVALALGGLGTIVVAHAVVQPEIDEGVQDAASALGDVQSAIAVLQERQETVATVFEESATLLVRLRRVMGHAVSMTEEMADTTEASADILRAAAKDLRMMADAVELFINEGGLVKTSQQMDQAAGQMGAVVKETRAMKESMQGLRASFRDVGEPMEELLKRTPGVWRDALDGADGVVGVIRDGLETTSLPLLMALFFDLFGLLLLASGVLLVIVSNNALALGAQSEGGGAHAAGAAAATGAPADWNAVPRQRALVPAEETS